MLKERIEVLEFGDFFTKDADFKEEVKKELVKAREDLEQTEKTKKEKSKRLKFVQELKEYIEKYEKETPEIQSGEAA